ncbi:MAG: Leucyl/phenylalanyl-tRNA--protein transferase, partial [uncultured Sphingomonadaceae bacterium]
DPPRPRPPALRLRRRRFSDGGQPRRARPVLGRTRTPHDPAAGPLPPVEVAPQDDPLRPVPRHPRPGVRARHAGLRRPRGDVDQPRHRTRLHAAPRGRPRPLDRVLVRRRASRGALRRPPRRRLFRRKHVQRGPRRVQGGARLARRAPPRRPFPPARLPVHDAPPRQPRRSGDQPRRLRVVAGPRRRRGGRDHSGRGRAWVRGPGPRRPLPRRPRLARLLAARLAARLRSLQRIRARARMRHRAALGPDVV